MTTTLTRSQRRDQIASTLGISAVGKSLGELEKLAKKSSPTSTPTPKASTPVAAKLEPFRAWHGEVGCKATHPGVSHAKAGFRLLKSGKSFTQAKAKPAGKRASRRAKKSAATNGVVAQAESVVAAIAPRPAPNGRDMDAARQSLDNGQLTALVLTQGEALTQVLDMVTTLNERFAAILS